MRLRGKGVPRGSGHIAANSWNGTSGAEVRDRSPTRFDEKADTLLGFLVLSALILCLLIAALIYQALGAKKDAERFPPPGRLVDVGGYRLHIDCMGRGSPTVVLESGIAASSLSWRLVQNGVAGLTRVCCYDRAGLAWSEPGPAPRSVEAIVEELHLLLTHAGIAGPYVLVGHSFGAFTARAYASVYPADLAGMVLIDPLHPSEWLEMSDKQERRLRGGVKLSRLGAVLAHVGVVRFCLALLGGGAAGVPPPVHEDLRAGRHPTGSTDRRRGDQAATGRLARRAGALVSAEMLPRDGRPPHVAPRERCTGGRDEPQRW